MFWLTVAPALLLAIVGAGRPFVKQNCESLTP